MKSKIRVSVVLVPSEGCERRICSILASYESHSVHMAFSLYTVCVQISPLYEDTSHIGLGPHLTPVDLILTNYI